MAATESNMMPLGTLAPDFKLIDAKENQVFLLNNLNLQKGFVIAFICNHCPYVIHILPKFMEVAKEYAQKGIAFIAINSNDAEQYPTDSFENMQKAVTEYNFPMPYLYDESQEVAKAYDAACTPDIYLFNNKKELVYRGQFDASRPGKGMPDGKDLKIAMNALVTGKPIPEQQIPSIGCSIKWK